LLEIDSGQYLKAWNKRLLHTNMDNLLIPENKIQAYKIQFGYEKTSKSSLVGWKIAATSIEGQKHIGVETPIAGRLIKERFNESGSSVSLKNNQMKKVEAEFAFKLLNDIFPSSKEHTIDEVLENIESVGPAIEIPDSRFKNFHKMGRDLLIADNACAGDYVFDKDFVYDFKNIDFKNFKVSCYKNNELAATGIGSNVLGSPLIALTWLINELSSLNITANKGQIIITGTAIKPLTVISGDNIVMDFNELGSVECNLA